MLTLDTHLTAPGPLAGDVYHDDAEERHARLAVAAPTDELMAALSARAVRFARFTSPDLWAGFQREEAERVECGADDEDDHRLGLMTETLSAELTRIADRMVRVRLLVVEWTGIDVGAAEKLIPGTQLAYWRWEVHQRGILPWLGRSFCYAAEQWIREEEAYSRLDLTEILDGLKEQAEGRNLEAIRLAAAIDPPTAVDPAGSPAKVICRESRPPPPRLATAGGLHGQFAPLN